MYKKLSSISIVLLFNVFSVIAAILLVFLSSHSASVILADDIPGCTNSAYLEYNPDATVDDGSCLTPIVYGCTNPSADNYDPFANVDNTLCIISGCTNPAATNYNVDANMDNGSCVILGCMDSGYLEYNPSATMSDGSCATPIEYGCTDPAYVEYNPAANTDDGSCSTLAVLGCTNSTYVEYNPDANVDDGSCVTPVVYGCTDSQYLEYNSSATVDDGSCHTVAVPGCMDSNYLEYNPLANYNDDSCSTPVLAGCTDAAYIEYNSAANVDDGSCQIPIVYGCTNDAADNFNSSANVDNGTCSFGVTLLGIDSTSTSGTYTQGDVIDIRAYFNREIDAATSSLSIVLNNGVSVLLNNLIGTSTLYGLYTVGSGEAVDILNASSTTNVHVIDNTGVYVQTSPYDLTNFLHNLSDNVAIQIVNATPPPGDVSGPVLSDITYEIGTSTVTISWITDEVATSTIEYGLTDIYDSSMSISTGTTTHVFVLTDLIPNTTYHHRLISTDVLGNISITEDQTFTTSALDATTTATTTTPVAVTVSSWSGPTGGSSGSGSFSSGSVGAVNAIQSLIPSTQRSIFMTSTGAPFTFSVSLYPFVGQTPETKKLQILLNALGFTVAKTGAGSPGKETDKFGFATQSALTRFQKANNIKTTPGFFGPVTREYVNRLIKSVLLGK